MSKLSHFIKTLQITIVMFLTINFSYSQLSPVKFEILSDVKNLEPNSKFKLAVRASIEKDWHIYWKGTGESGQPTIIQWETPEGFNAAQTSYPIPNKTKAFDLISHTYKNEAIFISEITTPKTLTETNYKFKAIVDWQACKESCLPPTVTELELSINAGNASKSDYYDTINLAWAKSHTQIPQLKAVAASDFGQLDLSFKITNAQFETIGNSPYFMPTNSSLIEEKEAQQTDFSDDVLTIFCTLEDEDFKIEEKIEGFLLSSDGSNTFWIETGISNNKANTENTITETKALTFPTKDSPEGQALTKAIKDLAKGYNGNQSPLSLMLLFALLGGIILNLMPCVFPVLGIKVLGFVQQAGGDKKKIKYHGLTFAAGITISLWVLVSILFYIKSKGQSAGWGFQLQNSWFVWALIVVMFVFALNLFGLFELGTSLTNAGSKIQSNKGYFGSFSSGLLTVLVATPCTGPFMGPTLALAISGPKIQGYLLFTMLAIGLSLPYVILAYFPKLIDALPRPGKWMETFKQTMAFPLLLTVVWLLNIIGKSNGLNAVIWILVGLIILSLGLWIYGKYSTPLKSNFRSKFISYSALLLTIGLFFKISYENLENVDQNINQSSSNNKTIHGITYEPFDPIKALDYVKNGRDVFIDYTAVW